MNGTECDQSECYLAEFRLVEALLPELSSSLDSLISVYLYVHRNTEIDNNSVKGGCGSLHKPAV